MFLMIGVTDGRGDLYYSCPVWCRHCGRTEEFVVFMTYTQLLLFFIPTFKWNKRYYVQCRGCSEVYELRPEVGKQIEKGQKVSFGPEDLYDTGMKY